METLLDAFVLAPIPTKKVSHHHHHHYHRLPKIISYSNDNTNHDGEGGMDRDCADEGKPLSRSAFLSSSVTAALVAVVAVTVASPDQVHAAAPLSSLSSSSSSVGSSSNPSTSTAPPGTSLATGTATAKTKSRQTFEETVSGFFAGAALSTTKTIVKYPLDTATVRLQMPNSQYSIYEPLTLLNGSFRGIATPLICNIPAGAVFFSVKDATKQMLKANDLPRWVTTSLAVLVATFPYMAVRNPSEVVKTRQQAGIDGYGEGVSALEAFQKVRQGSSSSSSSSSNGNGNSSAGMMGDFYVGYFENICYTYPADVLKFVTYDSLSGGRKDLPPAQGAVYGAIATAVAQLITTPLDVVRNRVMAGETNNNNDNYNNNTNADKNEKSRNDGNNNNNNNNNNNKKSSSSETKEDFKDKKLSYLESLSKIAKEEGINGLFAGASPRVGKAILSGAIQFATYEETKQAIAKSFQGNR